MITLEQAEIACRAAMDAGDWELVWSHYEPLIDELQALQRPQGSLPGAALWYASQGVPVFPCWPGGTKGRDGKPLDKAPMTRTGVKAATTDPAQIQSWWEREPRANIGLATGARMDVIDLDGTEAWAQWQGLATQPAVLGRVKTPRPGGWHLWVPVSGRGNRAGMLPGVDYRGAGGYVLAPPSQIVTDTYQGAYRWAVPPVLRTEQDPAVAA
ncbi:bifunctional DNA primase/polymerase [uncultured Citricoccus sp.]|uniref:bifunctional DNA primase/polymerase n=1 Tax=uncultured Citricoccus sp. TaxID=614031 RepID=UPI00260C3012|nr:bifunctional DNA primase/polymerase [uncultured Citricoccus sp.]